MRVRVNIEKYEDRTGRYVHGRRGLDFDPDLVARRSTNRQLGPCQGDIGAAFDNPRRCGTSQVEYPSETDQKPFEEGGVGR